MILTGRKIGLKLPDWNDRMTLEDVKHFETIMAPGLPGHVKHPWCLRW